MHLFLFIPFLQSQAEKKMSPYQLQIQNYVECKNEHVNVNIGPTSPPTKIPLGSFLRHAGGAPKKL